MPWKLFIEAGQKNQFVYVQDPFGNKQLRNINSVATFLRWQHPVPDHLVLDFIASLPLGQELEGIYTPLLEIAELCSFTIEITEVETPRAPDIKKQRKEEIEEIKSSLKEAAIKKTKGMVVRFEP